METFLHTGDECPRAADPHVPRSSRAGRWVDACEVGGFDQGTRIIVFGSLTEIALGVAPDAREHRRGPLDDLPGSADWRPGADAGFAVSQPEDDDIGLPVDQAMKAALAEPPRANQTVGTYASLPGFWHAALMQER